MKFSIILFKNVDSVNRSINNEIIDHLIKRPRPIIFKNNLD